MPAVAVATAAPAFAASATDPTDPPVTPELELIPQELLEIAGFSTDEAGEGTTNGGQAFHAIDGSETTFWHSAWEPEPVNAPHWITISKSDESAFSLGQVRYRSRVRTREEEGVWNGTALEIKVYVSSDNLSFTEVELDGRADGGVLYADRAAVNTAVPLNTRLDRTFNVPLGVTARYVRFEIVRGVNDNEPGTAPTEGFGHAAEINLYEWVTPAS